MDMAELTKTLSSFGISGLLLGVIVYILHYTIPNMQKRFDGIINEAFNIGRAHAESFRKSLDQQQAAYLAQLRDLSNGHIGAEKRFSDGIANLTNEIRNQTVALTAALRQSH